MFEAAIISFREGMEAFLIVAIMLAYLQRTGRNELASVVYTGVMAAIVLSFTLGFYLQSISDNPLTEGLMALTAGVLVGTMTVHMIRAAKTMKKSITDKLELHADKGGLAAKLGIFAFTVLMVTREGMETALLMNGALLESSAVAVVMGALAGLLLASGVAYLWIKKSHLINLPLFLQTSAIFLVMFSAYLALYGLHELGEVGGAFSFLYPFHDATEELMEGQLSNIIGAGLIVVPLGYLSWAMVKGQKKVTTA